MLMFNQEELEAFSDLSRKTKYQLWYSLEENRFYTEETASLTSHYIMDVEQEESPDFLAEITRVVLAEIQQLQQSQTE